LGCWREGRAGALLDHVRTKTNWINIPDTPMSNPFVMRWGLLFRRLTAIRTGPVGATRWGFSLSSITARRSHVAGKQYLFSADHAETAAIERPVCRVAAYSGTICAVVLEQTLPPSGVCILAKLPRR
jgi:hypothetical protein